MSKTLIFVYNATSGGISSYIDTIHKIISPSTYRCTLCRITHGNFSEKEVWKQYRKQTAHQFVFMHKNECIEKYGALWETKTFPMVVLLDSEGKFQEIIPAERLRQMTTVSELITEVELHL